MLFVLQDSDFFKLFDVDGDGLVSFYEYLMLVTFLSIPPEVWEWLLAVCRARVLCDALPSSLRLSGVMAGLDPSQCDVVRSSRDEGQSDPLPRILHAGGEDGLWHV